MLRSLWTFLISIAIAGFPAVAMAANVEISSIISLDLTETSYGDQARALAVNGLFCGVLLVMAVFKLFVYWHSRVASFFYHGAYGLCVFLMTAVATGLCSFFWQPPFWNNLQIILVLGIVAASLIAAFTEELLAQMARSQPLQVALRVFIASIALVGVIMLFTWHVYAIRLLVILACGLSVLLVACGAWLLKKKVRYGSFYFVAWLALFIGFSTTLLRYKNIFDANVAVHVPLIIGLIIEVVVISFVMAGSFADAREEKLTAQKESLRNAERANRLQQQALKAQANATEDLESKVQERTFELEVALRELEETNRQLEEQSTVDFLTGVKNRKHFDKRYLAEFRRSRREQTPLGIAMLDIDHFKSVNDTYGHLVGDECIRQVAHRIQSVLKRPTDALTRYGGEEFALILPATHLEGAMQVIEQVLTAIRQTPFITSDGALPITISAGLSVAVAQSDMDPKAILDAADQALYRAKEAGRDQAKWQHVGAPSDSPQASLLFNQEDPS
ncbi:diguanylate cyclase [Neiella marina]|uniref:diguanylate cyclase n=1 Tax=Neiella holothuriorum TaxID=2870530 RepID=A0ABS7EC82_9GAMM|nr:diguanylate cyclase [Neiella holothuriorum]MBW8189939.1 diguanylate cyclase [Neiella holothuriorum]